MEKSSRESVKELTVYNSYRGQSVVFNELQDKQTGYHLSSNTIMYLVILILMATCFGPPEHHLAILEKSDIQVTVLRDKFL